MSITRKELRLPPAQRDLVNYSVRAQDYILRQGMAGAPMTTTNTFKTTDDLLQGHFNSVNVQQNSYASNCFNGGASVGPMGPFGGAIAANTNVSTNISLEDVSKLLPNLNKSQFHDIADQLLLPSIKSVRKTQQSPFKGFLDTSSFSKKMRSTVGAQKGFDFGKSSPMNIEISNQMLKEEKQKMKSSMIEQQNSAANRMNPKILETWINETLQDAEHLDIPGVVLKPEHKNPISRYGIDRLALTNAGIPNELVDRIFRALFVYSVGFYELIKKCLQHTEKKYSIITSIWKVFSILLEYCCKTDYRMLISEISKEHKQELEKLEKEFQAKFQEQASNERILKANMEILSKYNEELEKERTNERQMRLKLEEEYMQNTKNHEEEVQLRLKFESKLNNMHSVHRDLETKYKRCLNEIATLQNSKEQLSAKTNSQMEEMTVLKTVRAEQESRLNYQEERLNALQREIGIKVRQVEEYEGRYTRTQDELDLTKYKHQEANKDITELKLRMDVYDSQVDGLRNEKQHLQLELKETKDLQQIYEKKCGQLMDEINNVNKEYQVSKREIIGFGEIQKEREDRIDTFKKELKILKAAHEELDLKHGTVSIQFEKVKEQYETCRRDLDDAIEKLHVTNKVRHETDVRYHEEIDKNRTLHEIIKDKEEVLAKRAQEIEDLDRKVIELERANEALEIKKAGVERQYDLTKKQLNEKISSLNDVLSNEKETRETWIERYEKEQREHTATNAQLLQTKSAHKDAVLQTKNGEIKLNTQTKANEVLTESNLRLQDQLNETLAKCENLERELNTQKEIMKQMEVTKKEYIQKLKRELETVEARFFKIIDLNTLTTEDYHSRAQENLHRVREVEAVKRQLEQDLSDRDFELKEKCEEIVQLKMKQQMLEMQGEEFWSRLCSYDQERVALTSAKNLLQMKCENLQKTAQNLKADNEVKSKYQNDYNEVLKELAKLKKEMNSNKQQSSRASLQGGRNADAAGSRAPSNTTHYVEKRDAFCQTIIQGSNIDIALMNANQGASEATSNNTPTPNSMNKGPAQRVGGGGMIRKLPEKTTNAVGGSSQTVNQQQQQLQSLVVGGDQSNNQIGKPKPGSKSMTKGMPNFAPQKEIVTNMSKAGQTSNINVYPQTATNQKTSFTAPGDSPHQETALQQQRQAESQQPSPRENNSQLEYSPPITTAEVNQNLQRVESNKRKGDEQLSNMVVTADYNENDTMISNSQSKYMSPDAHTNHDQHDNESSQLVMNSPQATINFNNSARMGGADYNQTNQNMLTQDSHTIGSTLNNNYATSIGNVNYNYSLEDQQHSIIHEQLGEDDEERKTPLSQQYRQQQAHTSHNIYNNNNGDEDINGGMVSSQGSLGRTNLQSAMNGTSDVFVVQYRGFNNNPTLSPNITNSNMTDNKRYNGSQHTISVSKDYQDNNNSHIPTVEDNQSITISNNNAFTNNSIIQQQEQSNGKEISIQQNLSYQDNIQQRNSQFPDETTNLREESFNTMGEGVGEYLTSSNNQPGATASLSNNSNNNMGSRTPPSQQQQQQQQMDVGVKGRLKIDIPNGTTQQPHMVISNLHSSMQTPQAQLYESGSQRAGLPPQHQQAAVIINSNGGGPQQQSATNKQVKGKSSIRTLIKSAATRDT